jgi:hypothetical protein
LRGIAGEEFSVLEKDFKRCNEKILENKKIKKIKGSGPFY